MKWILVLVLVFLIRNASARQSNRHHNNRNHKKYAHTPPPKAHALPKQQHLNVPEAEHTPELEVDALKCPLGCVCQFAHFMDLPISRWINHMQMRQRPERAAPSVSVDHDDDESAEELINDNEATYDGDDTFLSNPFIKQATCILQEDSDPVELINNLPHDLQALIILYTGIGRNKTVNASIMKTLNQLTTLEIRGPQDRTFRLVFDEPLSFLQHVNFESIMLLGSDNFKRPKNPVHPSDSFDYKPKSELFAAYETDNGADASATKADKKLGFEAEQDELEILPYDIYMMEVKKARMPTFYGWEHLEVLRIHSCQLNELHWEMFDGLEALQHLSLERNAIEVVPAFALYGTMNIKTLSLAHNRIHDLHYRALAGLLELQVLDLSDNRLGKLSELSFPPFPQLERVDFRNNPLRYIFPATFWVMNTTRTMLFDSREMALELWANMPFESLEELRELTIGNVSIGSLEHKVFKGLSSLDKLNLKGEIRSIEFDAFAGLTELRELDLSDCMIREVSMDAFMGCRKLETINLSRNNISYIPPGLFDDQMVLEEIYLDGNQLRTLPTSFFLQPKLRLARLSDNPWKCSCDMSNWRPKVTNNERGPRAERCITDYMTGKKIACRRVDNFKFEHRHAPRCDNHNGRSVFYVIRKQLQCGPGRLVHGRPKHRPPQVGVPGQRISPARTMQERREMHKEKLEEKPNDNRLTWQIQREQKMRRTMMEKNSLDYVLQQEQRKLRKEFADVDNSQTRNTKSNGEPEEPEVSNEI